MDSPPHIPPDERLNPTELGLLALRLLRELAANDPVLAERLRRLGLDPRPAEP